MRVMAGGGRGFSYAACPTCKKKVLPGDGGHGWTCERCQSTIPECKHTYNFSVQLGDFTTAIYAQVLGESVGEAIMGMPAKELLSIHERSVGEAGATAPDSEFGQIIEARNNTKGVFIIRAKVDNQSMGSEAEENRVRYHLSKFIPKDTRSENAMLLERLQLHANAH